MESGPITLASELETKSNAAKRERETFFNYGKAEAMAWKRLRPDLKGNDTIAGLPKPEAAEAVRALKRGKVRRAEICERLEITPKEYAACARYWKASKVERETRTLHSHCSLVGDIVNAAYIAWRFANFEGWEKRQREAAAKGKPCNPQSVEQAVKYAFGKYFRNERKRAIRGVTDSRSFAIERTYARPLATQSKPAAELLIDLPAKLPAQAAKVATLLARETSKADCADILAVSRPRVSQYVKQLADLPALRERAALLGILPPETRAALEQAEARREFAAEITAEQRERAALRVAASQAACRSYLGAIRFAWRNSEFEYLPPQAAPQGCKVRQAIRASMLARRAAKQREAERAAGRLSFGEYTREAYAGRVAYAGRLADLDKQLGERSGFGLLVTADLETQAAEAADLLRQAEAARVASQPVRNPAEAEAAEAARVAIVDATRQAYPLSGRASQAANNSPRWVDILL